MVFMFDVQHIVFRYSKEKKMLSIAKDMRFFQLSILSIYSIVLLCSTVIPFDRNIQGHLNVKILVGESLCVGLNLLPLIGIGLIYLEKNVGPHVPIRSGGPAIH